ncbi:hypothetical protein BHE74_00035340 [Ensete ventricosum]|nr:hypothetical protein GW17_00043957 [Ensete ventricosum]RWW57844.1 hypothetical protein BHE74_00035340 [Ensete ventricosum]RZS12061.1 hypothetical protein BHM03_00043446 [Ensete ventricosum]
MHRKPWQGAARHGYGQPPCRGDRPHARGDRLRLGPMQGAPTCSGSSPAGTNDCGQAASGGCPLQSDKGQLHGQDYHLEGRPLARAVADRGSARARRRRQPARCRPKAAVPPPS